MSRRPSIVVFVDAPPLFRASSLHSNTWRAFLFHSLAALHAAFPTHIISPPHFAFPFLIKRPRRFLPSPLGLDYTQLALQHTKARADPSFLSQALLFPPWERHLFYCCPGGSLGYNFDHIGSFESHLHRRVARHPPSCPPALTATVTSATHTYFGLSSLTIDKIDGTATD